MKLAGSRKGISFGVCLALFLGLIQFSPCNASDQPGKRSFLRNLSKIRQPGQNLHFIVYDTATYFGLSDSEKVYLLEFLKAVWEEPVTETHGLTIKEHGELKYFLSNAFKDTLRNYGWTKEEKNSLSRFKQLYFDNERMSKDSAVGREFRERYVPRVESVNPQRRENLAERNDEELIGQEDEKRKEKKQLEEQGRAKFLSATPRPIDPEIAKKSAGREVLDLGDPKFYHGLTQSEVDELFEFTKPIYSDTVRSREGENLKGQIFHFLLGAFNDTTRSYEWTAWEKQKLMEFRYEAERLRGLGLLSPAQKVDSKK